MLGGTFDLPVFNHPNVATLTGHHSPLANRSLQGRQVKLRGWEKVDIHSHHFRPKGPKVIIHSLEGGQ